MLWASGAEPVVMTTHVETQSELLAAQPRSDRQRELLRRSDVLLERLESLNLGHYGALREWSGHDDCRMTEMLTRAVNELLIEVDLDPRRLTTTREAMDAVFDAQNVLFGNPDGEEDDQ